MALITLSQDLLDTGTTLQQLAMNALMKGANNEAIGDYVVYDVSNNKISLDIAKLVLSKGGEVSDYPLFIEVNPTSLVPVALTGSKVTDENGNETRVRWEDWKRTNSTFSTLSNGKTYIGTNGHTGKYLAISELVSVLDKLITEEEYIELSITEEE